MLPDQLWFKPEGKEIALSGDVSVVIVRNGEVEVCTVISGEEERECLGLRIKTESLSMGGSIHSITNLTYSCGPELVTFQLDLYGKIRFSVQDKEKNCRTAYIVKVYLHAVHAEGDADRWRKSCLSP